MGHGEDGRTIREDSDVARCRPGRGGSNNMLMAVEAWEEERRKRRVVCSVVSLLEKWKNKR
jgi:hypothetical protein